jgi:hypothetical protein
MKVSRGKKHNNLGMTLDFTKEGEVKVTMIDCMKGVIEDFPEVITGRSATPAAENILRCDRMRAGSFWMKNELGHSTTPSHSFYSPRQGPAKTYTPPLHF